MDAPRPLPLLLAFDPLFFDHRSRGYHPERPERLDAARRGLSRCERAGVEVVPLAPRDATDDELATAHGAAYLGTLARAAGHHTALDADTYLSPSSVAAARRAAGGAIAMAEALADPFTILPPPTRSRAMQHRAPPPMPPDAPRRGVALLRPPGHHATRDQGMGFCLLNNVALAAYAALAKGLARVAIVDWDVHHGNGTQDIFWTDDRVLFISLHEHPLYPGTGAVTERGEGRGEGFTINIPLPAAANDAVYKLAFDEVVLPALHSFAPDLVLVSAGFDAHARDPLASMMLTEAGYGSMANALRDVADEHAGGRLGLVLEGGYDLSAIEGSIEATVLAALGAPPPPGPAAADPGSDVASRFRDAIAAAKRASLGPAAPAAS